MSQLFVDNIKGRTGGAIGAPSGAVVTGVTTATGLDVNGNADISGTLAVGGNVSVGGTLTYEDVTNIDSTGIITAKSGIEFGASGVGGTISGTGNATIVGIITARGLEATGVVTATSFGGSGVNLTNLPAAQLTGALPAIDGSALTGVVSGVDIESGGTFLGAGVTSINFQSGATVTASGAGSTITISAGITTTKYSPTANAIIQIGLGTAQHHELTLSAGFTTITTSGGTYGESHSLVLIQPSSGIATVGFSTFFQFPSGATPSMSEGSSKVDLVSFVVKDIAGNTGTGATELLASAGLNYS